MIASTLPDDPATSTLRFDEIIDTDAWSGNRRGSQAYAGIAARVRRSLRETSSALLMRFIRLGVLEIMEQNAAELEADAVNVAAPLAPVQGW